MDATQLIMTGEETIRYQLLLLNVSATIKAGIYSTLKWMKGKSSAFSRNNYIYIKSGQLKERNACMNNLITILKELSASYTSKLSTMKKLFMLLCDQNF